MTMVCSSLNVKIIIKVKKITCSNSTGNLKLQILKVLENVLTTTAAKYDGMLYLQRRNKPGLATT
jgi:hypothetical protein